MISALASIRGVHPCTVFKPPLRARESGVLLFVAKANFKLVRALRHGWLSLSRLGSDTLSHVLVPPPCDCLAASSPWSPSKPCASFQQKNPPSYLEAIKLSTFAGGCKQRAKMCFFSGEKATVFVDGSPGESKNTELVQCANLLKSPSCVYRLLPVHTSIQSAVMPESNYFNLSPSPSPSFSASQYFCGSWSRSAPPDGASSAWQGAM